MSEPTITKSTCELYKLRGLPHSGWADITIDAADHHGRIQIASDWGNWSYFWSACGGPFKEFLPHISIDYTAGKFGADSWFDAEATVKTFKQYVVQNQRSGEISKETSKAITSELQWLDGLSRRDEFCAALERDCTELMRMYEYMPDMQTDIHPMFRNFWRDCWPVFLAELASETATYEPV